MRCHCWQWNRCKRHKRTNCQHSDECLWSFVLLLTHFEYFQFEFFSKDINTLTETELNVPKLNSSISFCCLQTNLLKFATIMGMGSVMQRTPQMAHSEPTNFPAAVVGATSPYPWKFLWIWIKISNVGCTRACHGDDGPIQSLWQSVKPSVRFIFFQCITEPSEDEHSHAYSHTQE